jgi:hypothetical protein
MKRILFLPAFIIAIIIISSCGNNPKSKLIGTWKVSDVQTDFKEAQVTPEMLAQVVEMQKQTHFRFVNDSIMVIISNNNTHEAKWTFNEKENSIAYFFSGMGKKSNELGKLKEKQIVSESETPLGLITTYYEKE